MDISKEREVFQEQYKTSRDYKFYIKHEMSEKQIFEFKNSKYVVDCVNDGWKIWLAAKQQAAPDGFVLVPTEPTQKMLDATINLPIPAVYVDSISGQHKLKVVAYYKAMIQESQK